MQKRFRFLLILLSIYLSAGIISSHQQLPVFFEHGLRGNPERYASRGIQKLLGLENDTRTPYSSARGDAIPEELSETISFTAIQARNPLWRWAWRCHRELVLLRALRGSALGQQQDVQRLKALFEKNGTQEQLPESQEMLLVGHSNGAAIALNTMHDMKWRGGILFAPFCHGSLAFRHFPPLSEVSKSDVTEQYIVPAIRSLLVPLYTRTERQPIDLAASEMNKETPILIVSIKDDPKVPQYHQFALYLTLKKAGYTVYLYEVQHGDHEYIMTEAQQKQYPEEYAELAAVAQGFRAYTEGSGGIPLPLANRDAAEIERRLIALYGKASVTNLETFQHDIAALP